VKESENVIYKKLIYVAVNLGEISVTEEEKNWVQFHSKAP
jgi:hypothetical protein